MKSMERQSLQGEMGPKQGLSCGWVYEEQRPGTIQEGEKMEEEKKRKKEKKNSAKNCSKLLKAKSGLAWKYSTPGSWKYKWNLHPLAGFHQRTPPTAWERIESRARDPSSFPPWRWSVEGKQRCWGKGTDLYPDSSPLATGKGSKLCCTWGEDPL